MLLLNSLSAIIALGACANAVAINNGQGIPRTDQAAVVIPTIDPSVDPLTALQQLQEATLQNIEHQDSLRKREDVLMPPASPRSDSDRLGATPMQQTRCTLANARVRRDWSV